MFFFSVFINETKDKPSFESDSPNKSTMVYIYVGYMLGKV